MWGQSRNGCALWCLFPFVLAYLPVVKLLGAGSEQKFLRHLFTLASMEQMFYRSEPSLRTWGKITFPLIALWFVSIQFKSNRGCRGLWTSGLWSFSTAEPFSSTDKLCRLQNTSKERWRRSLKTSFTVWKQSNKASGALWNAEALPASGQFWRLSAALWCSFPQPQEQQKTGSCLGFCSSGKQKGICCILQLHFLQPLYMSSTYLPLNIRPLCN